MSPSKQTSMINHLHTKTTDMILGQDVLHIIQWNWVYYLIVRRSKVDSNTFFLSGKAHYPFKTLPCLNHRVQMCRQNKKLACWEATLAPFDRPWLPHFSENPDVHLPKNEPLSQEMHLKILHFSSGLKYFRGCREAAIHLFVKNRYHQQIPGIKLIQIGAISILLCQH